MNTNLKIALVCLAGIVIITLLSAFPFGFAKGESIAQTLPTTSVTPVMDEGQQYYGNQPGPVVYEMTFVNTFLPRQVVLPRATACLYNSKKHYGVYVNTHWQISSLETMQSDFGSSDNVVQIGRETRTVQLTIDQFVRWKHKPQPDSSPVAMPTPPPRKAPMPQATPPMVPPPVSPAGGIDYPDGFDTLLLFIIDKDGPTNFYPQCENLQPSDLALARQIALN